MIISPIVLLAPLFREKIILGKHGEYLGRHRESKRLLKEEINFLFRV